MTDSIILYPSNETHAKLLRREIMSDETGDARLRLRSFVWDWFSDTRFHANVFEQYNTVYITFDDEMESKLFKMAFNL